MSWQDRLTIAEFRGLKFKTDAHDARFGKRLAIHEYPGSDSNNIEDFGLKTGVFQLSAYFIGPDYDLDLNAFLIELDKPGADWLNHPWRGRVFVRAQDWSIHESNDKGGFASLNITFVKDGDNKTTLIAADRTDIAMSAISTYEDAVVEDFELKPLSADSMEVLKDKIKDQLEALRKLISLASMPLTWANQVISMIQGVKGDIAVLLGIPQQYANAVRSLMDVLGLGADNVASMPIGTRSRVVSRLTTSALKTAAPVIYGDLVFNSNARIENALRSRLMVSAAAQIALTQYQSADERDAVLSNLLTAIDGILPHMSDVVFQAALDMRTALIDALLAQDLKPTVYRSIINPLPSVVLAYQMGITDEAFIARNGIRHPLFVIGKVNG